MRMLITYRSAFPPPYWWAICSPIRWITARLGYLGLVILLILSPVFIKWHYPIMVFGLACPMTCFFLMAIAVLPRSR